ncbi:unnamed protein product, partial [Ixodes hexagonus]
CTSRSARRNPCFCLFFLPPGYSVRIRESNTPGRKVGLWGCDFCAFTHANVSKVQEHVSEMHLVALGRRWEPASWHGNESPSRAVFCDEGSNLSLPASRRPLAPVKRSGDSLMVQFTDSEDEGDFPPQPLVICKTDDEDDECCSAPASF